MSEKQSSEDDLIPKIKSSLLTHRWFWLAAAICFMVFAANHREFLIVSVIFGFISSWIFVPLWMRHKRAAEKSVRQPDALEQGRVKKLEERLENLEALLCRMDAEMNYQLERTLSAGKIVTTTDAGVSRMPTTFMNIASALGDRFQVLKELGRGGMGIVFQAYDRELKEQVAIKILSPLLSNDPDAVERLKREVSAARRVTHTNVIRIHDLSESNGLHYVSMEYFHGMNLKEYIRLQGGVSIQKAYQITLQICDGLEAAHREGVIHRDLKSQNVIIDANNKVKIIDFGLARNTQLEGMTATGLIMGTPEYMAPEQVSGKNIDERADVYSLGIILYELFTGHVPFTGESAIAVGFKQLKEPPPNPRSSNPQISEEVEAIILKALEKDRAKRFGSVSQLRAELQKAMGAPSTTALETEDVHKRTNVQRT